ncbi:hypothetical protein ACH9D2_03575 [Kocuria sp. M4R2S49]|uniref:hypothetical protein n=1 Tax=Kocuria rhizosphaericola TaxID=3376284 RepID=UPI00378A12AA
MLVAGIGSSVLGVVFADTPLLLLDEATANPGSLDEQALHTAIRSAAPACLRRETAPRTRGRAARAGPRGPAGAISRCCADRRPRR